MARIGSPLRASRALAGVEEGSPIWDTSIAALASGLSIETVSASIRCCHGIPTIAGRVAIVGFGHTCIGLDGVAHELRGEGRLQHFGIHIENASDVRR